MQVAKADGLQNHSEMFVGSNPTWYAKIMEAYSSGLRGLS